MAAKIKNSKLKGGRRCEFEKIEKTEKKLRVLRSLPHLPLLPHRPPSFFSPFPRSSFPFHPLLPLLSPSFPPPPSQSLKRLTPSIFFFLIDILPIFLSFSFYFPTEKRRKNLFWAEGSISFYLWRGSRMQPSKQWGSLIHHFIIFLPSHPSLRPHHFHFWAKI